MFNKISEYFSNTDKNTETDDLLEKHRQKITKKEKDQTEKISKIEAMEKALNESMKELDINISALKTKCER